MTEDDRRQSAIAGLVRASQAGDKAAFDRLVRLHQQQAMRLATGMLGDANDAAEVVQEALVKAYVRLGSLRVPGRFRVWLLRIVANEAVSRRRAQYRRAGFLRLAAGHWPKKTVRSPEEDRRAEDLCTAVLPGVALRRRRNPRRRATITWARSVFPWMVGSTSLSSCCARAI